MEATISLAVYRLKNLEEADSDVESALQIQFPALEGEMIGR